MYIHQYIYIYFKNIIDKTFLKSSGSKTKKNRGASIMFAIT
jgi:hypothetical protein